MSMNDKGHEESTAGCWRGTGELRERPKERECVHEAFSRTEGDAPGSALRASPRPGEGP